MRATIHEILGFVSKFSHQQVNIHGAALSSFLALLEYLYSDRLPKDATISEYKEVLILADRFCLPRLISVCEQAISQLITAGLKRKPLSQAVCVEIINLLLISQASLYTMLGSEGRGYFLFFWGAFWGSLLLGFQTFTLFLT